MGSEENCGGSRQKHFVETFPKFLPIAMGKINGSLYNFVEECEPEDLFISPDYLNSIYQREEDNDIKCAFWKKYNACVPV